MSVPAPSLERLQRWMQAVVVHPGSVEEAVLLPSVRAELAGGNVSDVILRSAGLTSVERVGIYQGMYLLRMAEALESDYPALAHFLGPRRFSALVRDYVQAHPSTSFTLNRLGDHLPAFVERSASLPRRAFCHDLARLERAVAQVFDAEESAALTAERIAAVPAESWERARLRPVSAFALLALRYPVNAYLQSLRDEKHDHPPSRREASWVAVYRRDYSVYRLDLSREAHDLLGALAAGCLLGDAVASVASGKGRRRPRPEDLFRWFRQWVAAGVFQAVEVEECGPGRTRTFD